MNPTHPKDGEPAKTQLDVIDELAWSNLSAGAIGFWLRLRTRSNSEGLVLDDSGNAATLNAIWTIHGGDKKTLLQRKKDLKEAGYLAIVQGQRGSEFLRVCDGSGKPLRGIFTGRKTPPVKTLNGGNTTPELVGKTPSDWWRNPTALTSNRGTDRGIFRGQKESASQRMFRITKQLEVMKERRAELRARHRSEVAGGGYCWDTEQKRLECVELSKKIEEAGNAILDIDAT